MDLSDVSADVGPTLSNLVKRGQELIERFHILKLNRQQFTCMKFFILFNPG